MGGWHLSCTCPIYLFLLLGWAKKCVMHAWQQRARSGELQEEEEEGEWKEIVDETHYTESQMGTETEVMMSRTNAQKRKKTLLCA